MHNFLTEHRLLYFGIDSESHAVSTMDKLNIATAREAVNTPATRFDVELQKRIEELLSLNSAQNGYVDDTQKLQTMYVDLHKEAAWHTLFTKDLNAIASIPQKDAVQSAITLREFFWKNTTDAVRKELTITYLRSHLSGNDDLQKRIQDLDDLTPADFATKKTEINDLLSIRAYMLGADGGVDDAEAQIGVDLLTAKAIDNGKPTGYFQQKFREACDILSDSNGSIKLSEDDLRDLPTFAKNVHGTELGRMLAIDGIKQWFNPLVQSYIEAKHARIVQTTESARMLDELKHKIDVTTPATFDRLVNGFRNLHPGVQLVTGALIAWLGYKQVQRAFFPSPEQKAEGGRWGSKLLVLGGLLFATRPMFKGTPVGEALDAGFNAMGSAASGTADAIKGGINTLTGRGAEHDRALGFRSESDSKDIVDNELTEDLFSALNTYGAEQGESEPLNKLRASMTLAQLPMKTLAKAFTASPDGRGGTLDLTPELLAQIAIITGNEPQNQVLIEQVKTDKAIWGNALAHMFYMVGVNLSNDATTRNNHVLLNAEASRLGGDYDVITDSDLRGRYIANLAEGLAIGTQTDFTFAQLLKRLSRQATALDVNSNAGAFDATKYAPPSDALASDSNLIRRERILPEGIVPDPSTAPEYNMSTPRPCTRVRPCCVPRCSSGPSVDPETTPGYIRSVQEKKTQWLRTLDAMHGGRPKLGNSYAEILLDRINDNPKIKFALPPNADTRLFHDEVQFWLNRDDKLRTIRIAAYNGYFTVERDQEGTNERTLPDKDQLRKIMTIVLPIALRYAQRIGQSVYIDGVGNEPASLQYGQPQFLENSSGHSGVNQFNRSQIDRVYGSSAIPGSSGFVDSDYNTWGAFPHDDSPRARYVQTVLNDFEGNNGSGRIGAMLDEVQKMKDAGFDHPHMRQVIEEIKRIGMRQRMGHTPTSSDVGTIEQNYMLWLRSAYKVHQERQQLLDSVEHQPHIEHTITPQKWYSEGGSAERKLAPANAFSPSDVIRITNHKGETVEFYPNLLEGVAIGSGGDKIAAILRQLKNMGIAIREQNAFYEENTNNRRIGKIDLLFKDTGNYKIEYFERSSDERYYAEGAKKSESTIEVNSDNLLNNSPELLKANELRQKLNEFIASTQALHNTCFDLSARCIPTFTIQPSELNKFNQKITNYPQTVNTAKSTWNEFSVVSKYLPKPEVDALRQQLIDVQNDFKIDSATKLHRKFNTIKLNDNLTKPQAKEVATLLRVISKTAEHDKVIQDLEQFAK